MNEKLAFWNGFIKAALIKKISAPSKFNKSEDNIRNMPAAIRSQMASMSQSQQQQLVQALTRQFGMSGSTFIPNQQARIV